ncbi:MAG: CPBP family intramembrane glutamic endopeptidase [Candidatus Bathyarchaeia archaeon]
MDRLMFRIVVFYAASSLAALLLDILTLYGLLPSILWGFIRMWSVALSATLCLAMFKDGVHAKMRKFLSFPASLFKLYLVAPLTVYAALGIYIALANFFGLFDFSAYIDLIAEAAGSSVTGGQAEALAYVQIAVAYLAAVTLNMVFALGEEIGWRGYLYDLLGSKPTATTALIIGVLWGLWHSPATILLGYNYQVNRLIGMFLFTILAILFTYPQILITSRAEGSVLPASSLHGAINSIWGLTLVASRALSETREILLGLGFMGIAAWTILDAALYMLKLRSFRRK